MTKRILILSLHPAKVSLCGSLAQAYSEGAGASGHDVRTMALADMEFDPDFGQASFRAAKALEPDLVRLQEEVRWAEHLVLVSPMWWGGLPAKAKGLIDRSFLPGFAFDPREKRMGLPKPLLAGRSARLILTADTPGWAFRLLYRSALRWQIRQQILGYTGIAPMRFSLLSPVEHSTPPIRDRWLADIRALGAAGA
ncbi:MAG: NAD(P)H-dependent oxidoreductase [Tabrizicola sp.]|nr:NAD(P)H-dependent oxidoreductase [Tabrizicola sp.]